MGKEVLGDSPKGALTQDHLAMIGEKTVDAKIITLLNPPAISSAFPRGSLVPFSYTVTERDNVGK